MCRQGASAQINYPIGAVEHVGIAIKFGQTHGDDIAVHALNSILACLIGYRSLYDILTLSLDRCHAPADQSPGDRAVDLKLRILSVPMGDNALGPTQFMAIDKLPRIEGFDHLRVPVVMDGMLNQHRCYIR